MAENLDLFNSVIRELYHEGVLEFIILVGSWCQYYYQIYFDYPDEIPAVRTMDLDLLIPNPPNIKKDINIPDILKRFDFVSETSQVNKYTKYLHTDLEIEFLIPELGRGKAEPYQIPKLHVNAQGLRYLHLLQMHTIQVEDNGIVIKVPEPTAFVLHKYIISQKRSKREKAKSEKDIRVASEISSFLIKSKQQVGEFRRIYQSLPKRWQADLNQLLINHDLDLLQLLKEKNN